jgi:hypothetical protein
MQGIVPCVAHCIVLFTYQQAESAKQKAESLVHYTEQLSPEPLELLKPFEPLKRLERFQNLKL